jgi:vacuolar protein sorting-associated protein 13A/C
MAELSRKEAIERFASMIDDKDGKWNHQYILKPVSGEGRVCDAPEFAVAL